MKCEDCDHLSREDSDFFGRYRCNVLKGYRYRSDDACSYFKKDTKNNYYKGYERAGCYITTIVCNILGYSDDCELLNTLRNFRDTYLKVNAQYLPILYEYDIVGPQISAVLENDTDAKQKASFLFHNFLIPSYQYIKTKEYEKAIDTYINMVNMLKENYNIWIDDYTTVPKIPMEILGKGRGLKKDSI